MEVLGNSKQTKDGKEITGSNYTCRLPQDLNIGSGSVARSRNESDIRLLLACKTQLSSEVIKWKTESLRLQKERDSARLKVKELDQVVGKYSEKMRELEHRLSIAEDENKKLKGRIGCISNMSALKKLSLSLDKFHSYPWSGKQGYLSPSSANPVEEKKSIAPKGDWKEVSQQMLENLKQEINELQQLDCSFTVEESHIEPSTTLQNEESISDGLDDSLENTLSGLISETVSVKQSLLEQRLNLKLLLSKAKDKNFSQDQQKKMQSRPAEYSKSNINAANCIGVRPSVSQSCRHSDDSFREFFTKQLERSQNPDKTSTTHQLFEAGYSQVADDAKSPTAAFNSKVSESPTEEEKTVPQNQRVCPICETSFDQSVPQDKFEVHVYDHLEVESASLLDQYVVL